MAKMVVPMPDWKTGRLTHGNPPLHIRRAQLAYTLLDTTHMIRTMLANYPAEYAIPEDHDLMELIRVMDVIAKDLETPNVEPIEEAVSES